LLHKLLARFHHEDCCCDTCGSSCCGGSCGAGTIAAPAAEPIGAPKERKEMPKGEPPMKIGGVTQPLDVAPATTEVENKIPF
jgi:hypothetical protein